ncbi:MAG: hypothetical protein ACJA1C_002215 [Crocinitomicaceae bacterium]|jgi:hypothetical protein
MNLTQEQAIEKARTILEDINFMDDDVVNPSARLLDQSISGGSVEGPFWLVGFSFAAADFGPDRARIFLEIDQSTGKLINKRLSKKGGSILVKYNDSTNKYEREE